MEKETKIEKLRDLASGIFMGTNLARIAKDPEGNTLASVIHVKDVIEGTLPCIDDLDKINVPPNLLQKKQSLRPNDVLVSARGTLMKIAVVPTSYEGALASANFIVVRLKENAPLRPELLYGFLRQSVVKDFILNRATGTAQPVLAIRDLENLMIPVPPRDIQELLVRLLEVSEEQHRVATECARLRTEETMDILAKYMDPQNAVS
jgi:restriction endonuclease S subunit